MNNLEQKLQQLRKDWTKYPEKRSVIELQARVLKSGLLTPKKPTVIELQKKYNR